LFGELLGSEAEREEREERERDEAARHKKRASASPQMTGTGYFS